MRTKRHMSVNIEGVLRNYKGKKMDGLFTDENGKPISDGQARVFLHNCQVDGHKLVPAADCEGFDPFGGGCPGHPMDDEDLTPNQ